MAIECPISIDEYLEAIVDYEVISEVAAALPTRCDRRGGRKAIFPAEAMLIYGCLCSVFKSARWTETNIEGVWRRIRKLWKKRYPERSLPKRPPQRHHWQTFKHNIGPEEWAAMREAFRFHSADTALEIGLFDPTTASLTHPDELHLTFGDGHVTPAASRYAPGSAWTDLSTGEVKIRRSDPEAGWYTVGGGVDEDDSEEGSATPKRGRQQARGLKVAFIAARTGDPWGRVILDFDACWKGHGEMVFFHESMDALAPLLPGMTGSVWDGAAFGKDAERFGRTHGKHLMSKVKADVGGHTTGRDAEYKPWGLGVAEVVFDDGAKEEWPVYGIRGRPYLLDVNVAGDDAWIFMDRIKCERPQNNIGYRMYNVYRVEISGREGTVRLRLFNNDEDNRRKINRSQNLRSIPEDDHDFELYGLRNDAESINDAFNRSLPRGKSRSYGLQGHLLDWLGFALLINGLPVYVIGVPKEQPPRTRRRVAPFGVPPPWPREPPSPDGSGRTAFYPRSCSGGEAGRSAWTPLRPRLRRNHHRHLAASSRSPGISSSRPVASSFSASRRSRSSCRRGRAGRCRGRAGQLR